MAAFKITVSKRKELEKLMKFLQAEGIVERGKEKNVYVLWRYHLYRFDGQRYYIKCYSGKKGDKLDTSIPGLSALISKGSIKEVKTLLVSMSASKEDSNGLDEGLPYGRLERIGRGERATGEESTSKRVRSSDLSADQSQVLEEILSWINDPREQVLKLGGYAGTGKTTLISVLAEILLKQMRIAFCAFTGKAANVLRQKLRGAGVDLKGVYCGTIHGLIYDPVIDERNGNVLDWVLKHQLEQELLLIDEASMVNGDLWRDLLSYKLPILAVGDHGQLPPVSSDNRKGQPIYLMETPDLRLEQIHRQAESNPILELATHIRNGGEVLDFRSSSAHIRFVDVNTNEPTELCDLVPRGSEGQDFALLCFRNRTRSNINLFMRAQAGLSEAPLCAEEVVVCLRNTRFGRMSIFNGMRGVVKEVHSVSSHHLVSTVDFLDDGLRLQGKFSRHQFGRLQTYNALDTFRDESGLKTWSWEQVGLLFDYGYALTVHKAQGSQFNQVLIVLEDSYYLDREPDFKRRWLYTAITRAVDKITLVLPTRA